MRYRGIIEDKRPLGQLDLRAVMGDASGWEGAPNWEVKFNDSDIVEHRRLIEEAGFVELGRVADIGSGFGRISVLLAERNPHVVGVDRSEGGIEIGNYLARYFKLPGLSFIQASSEDLPLENECCDGVWFFTALQFMHRQKALAEAYRILKRNGRLFVGRYNTISVIVEKYIYGYQNGGRNSTQCNWARRAFTNGPNFDGGANWVTEDTAQSTFQRHGFLIDSEFGVRITPKWDVNEEMYSIFNDRLELIRRLDTDDGFVDELIGWGNHLSEVIPGDVQIVATKN